jgi:methylated-DNA-[protein]-cysteine S-methyltransferase
MSQTSTPKRTSVEARLRSSASGAPGIEDATERLLARVHEQQLADVTYASAESPFGPLLLASSRRGLLRLAFPEESVDHALERVALRFSPRIVESRASLDPVLRELDEYFEGKRNEFALAQDWSLMSEFSKRVLRATYDIPYGHVSTYKTVATEAGSPRGSRAAGNALGANPIPIVVPCHRVLHSGGGLGGYGGGLERKRWLLELEGALQPAPGEQLSVLGS